MSTDTPIVAEFLPEPLGRYRLERPLGKGGMGEVWLAHDLELDRPVALKLLPPELVPDERAALRLQREARALARLDHPNVIRAYDSGRHDGRPFLAMEYVAGESLAALLTREGRLPPGQATDCAYQAALALAHAHGAGLVHRDLKPSNLLRTPDGRVKLLDLGLARFVQDQAGDPDLTREGTGMGTPDYAAPEQFRDARKADARSDVYALGCTLYHLLAGRVPFPTSSLSEKSEAHARREPVPLAELCPEVPAGLALAVEKMMAKRPAERFPTASAVAEALAPYVAASSSAFLDVRRTSTWDGGQLLTSLDRPRRRIAWRLAALTAGIVLVALVAAVVVRFALPRAAAHSGGPVAGTAQPEAGAPPVAVANPREAAADVLTVSQDPRDGGQFRTINEALAQVKPGQTIRVLDQATYVEQLAIGPTSQHAGITLESPRHATITSNGGSNLIEIQQVPRVTIRGFRLSLLNAKRGMIVLERGVCPGGRLEDLELSTNSPDQVDGIVVVANLSPAQPSAPIVIRSCRLRNTLNGIVVNGLDGNYHSVGPVGRVLIHDNQIVQSKYGIAVGGDTRQVMIVGNRIVGSRMSGIELKNLLGDARDLLIANNTILESRYAFRGWDTTPRGRGVRVCNNLMLASTTADMIFVESDNFYDGQPGEGSKVPDVWQFAQNWREGAKPTVPSVAQAWIPPQPTDVLRDHIKEVNRDPASPDYLRPAKGSPLATQGAGRTDPTLPRYVGALPPAGAAPWDWDRTWRMPASAQLLTVSKDAKDGGKYRTIAAALKDAKPWATIRVLDDTVYEEALTLADSKRFEGISLEAPRQATLKLPPNSTWAVRIDNVPYVRVSGFRFRGSRFQVLTYSVLVKGMVPGLVLDDLDIQTAAVDHFSYGIALQDVQSLPGGPPAIARHCHLSVSGDGIIVVSHTKANPAARCDGLQILGNRVVGGTRGILVIGRARRLLIAGNSQEGCRDAGLQVEDPSPDSGPVLVANNTAVRCGSGFRLWLDEGSAPPTTGQVELRNNVWLTNTAGDLTYIKGPRGQETTSDDLQNLLRLWSFGQNGRDLAGMDISVMVPLAAGDIRLDGPSPLPLDPAAPNYLRPNKDSPLATRGAGTIDPSLPSYIGALPPEGVAPWDWSRTWRARMMK